MSTEQLTKHRRHQLRTTFWDFVLRGEGDEGAVTEALEAWRACGAISDAEADRWLDALRWRELGGFLPGWELPPSLKEKRGEPGEPDLRTFEAWRAAGRNVRAA